MANARGQRTTSNITATQAIRDVAAAIYNPESKLNKKGAGLTVLLNNIEGAKKKVTNFKFECYAEALLARGGTCTGGAAKNATSIVLDSTLGAILLPSMVLYVPSTKERILVVSGNPATYTWTIIRNLGAAIVGTDGQTEGLGIAIGASAEIKFAGFGKEQGGTMPSSISGNPEASYNYTQIFEDSCDLAGTLTKMALYGEKNPLDVRTKKMLERHMESINRAFWMGARRAGINAINGKPEYFTGGVLQHIKGNLTSVAGGIITMKVVDAFAELVFENGSDVRYLFGGMRFASCLDNLPRSAVKVNDGVSSFGTDMREVKTNKGLFRFVLDNKVFEGEMGIQVPCLDLEDGGVQYAYLDGRDTTLERDVQNKKDDEKVNLVRTECGLYMPGYGLDHSLVATTGAARSPHGLLYTTETAFTY